MLSLRILLNQKALEVVTLFSSLCEELQSKWSRRNVDYMIKVAGPYSTVEWTSLIIVLWKQTDLIEFRASNSKFQASQGCLI